MRRAGRGSGFVSGDLDGRGLDEEGVAQGGAESAGRSGEKGAVGEEWGVGSGEWYFPVRSGRADLHRRVPLPTPHAPGSLVGSPRGAW